MSGRHRPPLTLSRRAVLGLGLAAVASGTAITVRRWRAGSQPEQAYGPAGRSPSPAVRPGEGASELASEPVPTAVPTTSGKGSTGGPVPVRAGKVMLGAYLDLDGMSFAQSLALRRRQLGRQQRIVHVFYGWTDPLPTRIAHRPPGAIPMVSWRGTSYPAILDGSSDRLIAAAARNLAKLDRPAFLRWGWEMNGDWYPWGGPRNGGEPGGYVKCWRRMHQIFQAEGADNVAWVWSVNWNSRPNTADNRFQAYYPGDRYVDWVGMSGYNLHGETPQTLFEPVCAAYGGRKPVFITECGAVDRGGTTKGDWVRAFTEYVGGQPAIGAVTWFDTDTHATAPTNWRIDTNADALAAYRELAKSPRFDG